MADFNPLDYGAKLNSPDDSWPAFVKAANAALVTNSPIHVTGGPNDYYTLRPAASPAPIGGAKATCKVNYVYGEGARLVFPDVAPYTYFCFTGIDGRDTVVKNLTIVMPNPPLNNTCNTNAVRINSTLSNKTSLEGVKVSGNWFVGISIQAANNWKPGICTFDIKDCDYEGWQGALGAFGHPDAENYVLNIRDSIARDSGKFIDTDGLPSGHSHYIHPHIEVNMENVSAISAHRYFMKHFSSNTIKKYATARFKNVTLGKDVKFAYSGTSKGLTIFDKCSFGSNEGPIVSGTTVFRDCIFDLVKASSSLGVFDYLGGATVIVDQCDFLGSPGINAGMGLMSICNSNFNRTKATDTMINVLGQVNIVNCKMNSSIKGNSGIIVGKDGFLVIKGLQATGKYNLFPASAVVKVNNSGRVILDGMHYNVTGKTVDVATLGKAEINNMTQDPNLVY